MNRPLILENILQAIGQTPLVRLNRIGAEFGVEILAKCEYLNPGGSVKDRIGYRMVEEAERSGRIKPGDTLIEPTSGNTGIGLALAGAVKGYKVIITMTTKMSAEKQLVMEALGAEIIRTPQDVGSDHPESNLSVARRLATEIPNAHILDQYGNVDNPLAHYYGTGLELVEQTEGKLDAFVCGIGTGGTLTGTARRIREDIPGCRIVAVDPVGSIMGGGTDIAPYLVEGIGYDFIPDAYDASLVDEVIKTTDRDAFAMAGRLISEEGMLVGGSSGSAVWAAIELAKSMPKGSRVAVILPDSIRNYMTKFLDPKWMEEHGFSPVLTASQ
ncbi:MAG TPA: pyridoxal-phosphate dependent enzyme [Fimbriimonadaceae bacterium]|nr:pyridoxal-phosphate dependent enzyme [Fimbriimonadaceae bacterium]